MRERPKGVRASRARLAQGTRGEALGREAWLKDAEAGAIVRCEHLVTGQMLELGPLVPLQRSRRSLAWADLKKEADGSPPGNRCRITCACGQCGDAARHVHVRAQFVHAPSQLFS